VSTLLSYSKLLLRRCAAHPPTSLALRKARVHSAVEQLNEIVSPKQVPDHDKKSVDFSKKELGKLVQKPISQFPAKRTGTFPGCSSSEKSIFACFIAHALLEKGFDCVVLATDNYYKMRVHIPIGHEGLKHFECIEAFDVPLLANRVRHQLVCTAILS
jgi:hypothetical protein